MLSFSQGHSDLVLLKVCLCSSKWFGGMPNCSTPSFFFSLLYTSAINFNFSFSHFTLMTFWLATDTAQHEAFLKFHNTY